MKQEEARCVQAMWSIFMIQCTSADSAVTKRGIVTRSEFLTAVSHPPRLDYSYQVEEDEVVGTWGTKGGEEERV
jgi:hypothetical protein